MTRTDEPWHRSSAGRRCRSGRAAAGVRGPVSCCAAASIGLACAAAAAAAAPAAGPRRRAVAPWADDDGGRNVQTALRLPVPPAVACARRWRSGGPGGGLAVSWGCGGRESVRESVAAVALGRAGCPLLGWRRALIERSCRLWAGALLDCGFQNRDVQRRSPIDARGAAAASEAPDAGRRVSLDLLSPPGVLLEGRRFKFRVAGSRRRPTEEDGNFCPSSLGLARRAPRARTSLRPTTTTRDGREAREEKPTADNSSGVGTDKRTPKQNIVI